MLRASHLISHLSNTGCDVWWENHETAGFSKGLWGNAGPETPRLRFATSDDCRLSWIQWDFLKAMFQICAGEHFSSCENIVCVRASNKRLVFAWNLCLCALYTCRWLCGSAHLLPGQELFSCCLPVPSVTSCHANLPSFWVFFFLPSPHPLSLSLCVASLPEGAAPCRKRAWTLTARGPQLHITVQQLSLWGVLVCRTQRM